MTALKAKDPKIAFSPAKLTVAIANILPIRAVNTSAKKMTRYRAIVSSIKEVGLIEPIMVYPQKGAKGFYLIMDGHYRWAACKELGITEVDCLVALDDESYIYNAKVNRLAPIQEQKMILKAIENGVPLERIAAALNIKESDIRAKTRVTDGLCQEVVDALKDKQIAPDSLRLMRKVVASRQMEIAGLLSAANNYSKPYVEALILSTPKEKFMAAKQAVSHKVKPHELHQMECEMEALEKQYRLCEQKLANDMLNLTLFRGFVKALLANARIERFLKRKYGALQKELAETAASEAIL